MCAHTASAWPHNSLPLVLMNIAVLNLKNNIVYVTMWWLVMYSNHFNWNCVEIVSAYKKLFLSGAFLGMFVFTAVSLHYQNDYIHLYGIIFVVPGF